VLPGSLTITFNSNGGTPVSSVNVQKGNTVSIPATTRTGYTLDGWYTSLNGGVTLDERWSFTSNVVNNNITLYAKWNINQYTITFDTQGGSLVNSITQDFDTNINSPQEPTKLGHLFSGWNTAIPITMPASNITITATWSINSYTLIYKDFDNSNLFSENFLFNSDLSAVTITDPVRVGYTFIGWSQVLPTNMPASNITIYANYRINSYTLTLDTNGGTSISTLTLNYGSAINLSTTLKTGHSFQGWFTDIGLIQAFTLSTMPASNLSLYAKWTINQYTITFETNGGSSIAPIPGNFGDSVSVPNDPTREGYTFSGWYADVNLTQVITLPNSIPAQNLTLYASWIINQYTITFNTDGGDSISTQTNTYNASLSIPNATRVGHTFAGWHTDDGLTQAFTLTSMPASNLMLYAKWTINQYTISFNSMLLTPFAKIETGPNNSFAITSLGQIYSWGSDLFGQLGSGDSRYFPEKIIFPDLLLGEMITEISANANGSHTLALSNFGKVYAWGRNQFGRLGDGTDINRGTPVLTNFTSSGLMESEKIVTIKAATSHSIALTNQGRIFVWGDNSYGQIGDGRSSAVYYPKLLNLELQENEKATQIEVGDNHNVVLTSNSRIFTWGFNNSSQLGDGTTIDKKVPTLISNAFLSENEIITKIYSGSYYNYLTTSNGKVYGWGDNFYGVLGNGTQDYLLQPTLITFNNLLNSETFVSFDLGIYHSLGITNLGNIYSWGRNTLGRLGNGTNVDSYSPVLVLINQLVENEYIVDFSAGFSHSLVLTNIGRTIVWGYNGYGQLGDGSNINKVNPFYLTNDYFEAGGFSANYTEVTYSTIILLENPLMEGYIFDGWYQDEELLLEFDIVNMPAENITIYAKFIPN
jgi:uncharacterized repeat protein (TIGR02543 family)